MKKVVGILLDKSLESLLLSVELFNRPFDTGRTEAVLIHMDHAFELFLKAAIINRGGEIRRPREKQTIGFDECVRRALSDGKIRFLDREEALLLQTINGLRDAAYHHYLDISEELLYANSQGGLSLYKNLFKKVFDMYLYDELPKRVLPLSTIPPTDLDTMFASEIREIRKLLSPGTRKGVEAIARLRSLAIVDSSMQGE